ncbi:MAG: AAA family ATPase [Clostridia bacterium]|nr:AAA family ATPase [Clostridia bacterium]MBQ2517700.1 AAA family ATPase [Clostridia bacterium]MBQ4341065.1 AAA family ATPase [Clostridia bacterium]
MDTEVFVSFKKRLLEACGRVIVGKDEAICRLGVCLIAQGHVLLEDLPGTGKTMLLRAFSRCIGGEFRRIQFTPDILPSDLTGIHFYDQKQGEFVFRPGPLFANVVLADEINRAVPRSQSALLEAMEERQISIDGVTYPLDEPYMVMATQNPVESYGTFPLPEAQLDRFFMKTSLGYMTPEQEKQVMRRPDTRELVDGIQPIVTREELAAMRREYRETEVSEDVADYIMSIITATRESDRLQYGVSARGSIALYKAAQITAAMDGRSCVLPEDVKACAVPVLAHRISTVARSHMDTEGFIARLLDELPVPLE